MAIGRTFKEAFQKALRALETGRPGWAIGAAADRRPPRRRYDRDAARRAAPADARADLPGEARARARHVGRRAVRAHGDRSRGSSRRCEELLEAEREYRGARRRRRGRDAAHEAARLLRSPARRRCAARARRRCASGAGRSASGRRTRWSTPAPASSRRRRRISTAATTRRARRRAAAGKSVVILGSGPNRIGQGVEFDYCCVRAVMALREQGYETIMINSNPETVSTDFDTSDKLYFEPLTLEDVLEIVAARAADRRDRAARRPDAAQADARARGGGRDDPRHVARLDRHRGGPSPLRADRARARADAAAERHGDAASRRRSRPRSGSAIRCSCARATCSAAARCRSCYDAPSLRGLLRDRGARVRGAPGAHRPLPRGRVRGATSTRSPTASRS